MIQTPFGEILRQAVEDTPGAVGGALAASDGETVDSWTHWEQDEWALLTAHFGILVVQIRSALHTFHFGDVETMYLGYNKLELLIEVVADGYFALLALTPPVHLGSAAHNLRQASTCLRLEMG